MAAVRGQEFHQLPHLFQVGTVAQESSFPRLSDQPAVMEFFQVKGQRVGRNRQRIGDLTGIKAVITGAHQQAKYP